MLLKCLLLIITTITLILLIVQCVLAKEYQFVPGRCEDYPGVEAQIGGPLSLCGFPPNYEKPDKEDIDAVIKHFKGLQLN